MEETFRQVERWWLELQDRAGYRIVARIQEDFGPHPSLNAEDVRRALDDTDRRFAEMFRWMPGQSIASAFFDAWLLQPEASRDVSRTVSLVRQVLDRQLEAARHDIAAFGGS